VALTARHADLGLPAGTDSWRVAPSAGASVEILEP
jgi:hypothetical protein